VAACHARITELATVAEHPDFTEALAELIPEQPSIGALIQAYGSNGSLDGMHLGLQRSLTQLVEKADRARMEPTLSVEAKALLVSNSAQWASMWLVTVPADSKPWLRLSDELFRIAMHLRLGLKITAPDIPCVCGREPSLQAKPWHPLSCDSNSGLWSARHDGVKQIIASLMTAAGASVLIEPTPGQMRRGFSDGRRPDLLIHMGHRTILADVTVKHPLAPSYVPVLSQTPLGVAREGERIKNRLYAAEARAMGMEFIPISIETTGGWGPAAVELVKAVASHAVEHSSLTRAEALGNLIQGTALAVQRGNAYLVLTAYQKCARAHADRGLLDVVPVRQHMQPRGAPRNPDPHMPQPIRPPLRQHDIPYA
jgi:hypothetical protein